MEKADKFARDFPIESRKLKKLSVDLFNRNNRYRELHGVDRPYSNLESYPNMAKFSYLMNQPDPQDEYLLNKFSLKTLRAPHFRRGLFRGISSIEAQRLVNSINNLKEKMTSLPLSDTVNRRKVFRKIGELEEKLDIMTNQDIEQHLKTRTSS